jgi:hypothetical protein
MTRTRHVSWANIADHIASSGFGWREVDDSRSLIDVFNDPPSEDTSANSRQQTVLLLGLLSQLQALTRATVATRRAIDRLPEKLEKQRLQQQLKLAKEQRKAADARERAAKAELDAKFAEPPVMYQCDKHALDMLTNNVRRLF